MFNIIKTILSILFLSCLQDMPYGYFQLVRFLALIGFTYLAYNANQKENQRAAVIYFLLAVLFQPFIKISLGRALWNIVDSIVAISLIVTIITSNPNRNKKEKNNYQ